MRMQVSQGLALPIQMFSSQLDGLTLQVGLDVTDQVKILHYTKPTNTQGDVLHHWPQFLRKTDQPNLRSTPEALPDLAAQPSLVFTLKMDGTSATYFYRTADEYWGMCSRNFRLEKDPYQDKISQYRQVATLFGLEERMRKYGKNIALQGEICGPGINSNPASYTLLQYFIFHVWDTEKQVFYDFDDMLETVKALNAIELTTPARSLLHVPIIERGPLGGRTLSELVATTNKLTYAPGKLAEGMVICSSTEIYSAALDNRLSVKLISEPFEFKHSS